ncbi:hypothetical protein [Kitasatospora sp. GP82]|uniref:hypothetical protein n=1 Tax=Kitasatospora sp. GP82 TaxID=3035089 RepID=UPI00247344BA|nr:hypothetical protein [Kitasatospora sp. GP82]MDH6126383.1 hypothetical protein [Kitasatospora sp. GP82]
MATDLPGRVRPTSPGPRRASVLTGAAWLSARQERTAFAVAAAVLVAVCGWLLFLGHGIDGYIAANHLQGCNIVYFPPECQGTGELVGALDMEYGPAVLATGWVLLALPPTLGLFLGAPLLAREFENGAYRLWWTQSVSRRRWLAARLGVPLAVTLVGSTILAVVSTWWVRVVEGRFAVPGYYHWFTWLTRNTVGPAVVGFCLVGVALGAAVGLIVRRTVASIVVTAVATLLLRLLVDRLRLVLETSQQAVANVRMAVVTPGDRVLSTSGHLVQNVPHEAYELANGFLTSDGLRIPQQGDWNAMVDGRPYCPSDSALCLAHQHDIVQAYVVYHPASAEWPMLWTETGICLLVTVVLVAFCFLRVGRLR